jgi:Tlde1 domain
MSVIEWDYNSSGDDQTVGSRNSRPQRLLAGVSIACVAFACTWIVIVNLTGPEARAIDATRTVFDTVFDDIERAALAAPRADKFVFPARNPVVASAAPAAPVATPSPQQPPRPISKSDALLFDPHFAMGTLAQRFDAIAPAQQPIASAAPVQAMQTALETARQNETAAQPDQVAQAPVPQPAAPKSRMAALRDGANRVASNAVADTRSIFEKLFGRPASSLTLAFASDDTSSLGNHNPALGLYDRSTAVYDISAHKVYLPDGTTLEAHSGLGPLLDDPSHPEVKNRGVTPPAVYDLQPREALFHGVEALRLIPEDEGKALGRDGLLAHTFMLGPNGDSNGCVSFRDYETFLRAYKNHEITRLAVVARLD